jgi:hypothetical protein
MLSWIPRQQLPAAATRVAQVPPPAPVKRVEKRRGAHPPEPHPLKVAQSCGAQTRARRLLAAEELAVPSLKAFWPAR